MDSLTVKDVILDKKLDGYGINNDNFKASSEIMVEITLNEYRDLVSSKATKNSDIEKVNKDKYERDKENESLKKQLEELKLENYEMRKKLESMGVDSKEREEEE